MRPDESKEFDMAARRIFGNLATELGVQLLPFDSGYELCSGIACIRIRRGIGHVADVLGTIVPAQYKNLPLDENTHEVGLRVAAEFINSEIVMKDANTISEKIEREAEYVRTIKPLFESETLWAGLEQSVMKKAVDAVTAVRQRFPELS